MSDVTLLVDCAALCIPRASLKRCDFSKRKGTIAHTEAGAGATSVPGTIRSSCDGELTI